MIVRRSCRKINGTSFLILNWTEGEGVGGEFDNAHSNCRIGYPRLGCFRRGKGPIHGLDTNWD